MFVVPPLAVLATAATMFSPAGIARLPSALPPASITESVTWPVLFARVSDVVLYSLVFLAVFALIAVVAFFVWLRTLFSGTLSNIAAIELDESNPAVQEVQRLELQYSIAEDLDYPGEILVHLEAQLNAAKIAASGNPDANLTIFISPVPELAGAHSQYFVIPPVPHLARVYLEPLYTEITSPAFPAVTPKTAGA